MSSKIPDTQLKGNEEAAIHDPPSSITSENNRRSKKKRITKIHSTTPGGPTNRCTPTSDHSEATISHHNCHSHAWNAPPPGGTRAIRHFEAIFDFIFDGVNDIQYQRLYRSKHKQTTAGQRQKVGGSFHSGVGHFVGDCHPISEYMDQT